MNNHTPDDLTGWTLEAKENGVWREVGPKTFRALAGMNAHVRRWQRIPEPPPFHKLLEQMGIDPAAPGVTVTTMTGEGAAAFFEAIGEPPDDDNCADDPDDLWADDV